MHPTGAQPPATPHSRPAIPGMTLGDLRGRGVGSEVYAARRTVDGWPYAIKVVGAEPAARAAARREIDVLTAVRLPGLMRLYDVLATDDGRLALVLDLVDGPTLRQVVVDRGVLWPREAVGVLRALLKVLAGLHRQGIAHGDLAPGNVLVAADGRAVLGDLGSARLVGERHGPTWGTRGFVAPEVLAGAPPSAASDVYGVGALAWLMVTGTVPGTAYDRPRAAEAMPDASPELVELIAVTLAPDPTQRPSAAQALTRCAGLGPDEPLALPDGPDVGDRLTSRVRRPGAVDRDAGAAAPAWPADPLRLLEDGSEPDRTADPGRHRGAEPRPSDRAAAACARAVTGPRSRLLAAALVGVLLGLLGCVGLAVWRQVPLPIVGQLGAADRVPATATAAATATATDAVTATSAATATAAAPSEAPPSETAAAPSEAPPSETAGVAAGAAARAPARALPALLAARATAYATADPAPLQRCYTADAAALLAARREVAQLRATRTRYAGLSYTVTQARELATEPAVPTGASDPSDLSGPATAGTVGAGQVRVEAVVATSAFQAVRPDGTPSPGESAAAPGERHVFVLRWTESGWRVAAVES